MHAQCSLFEGNTEEALMWAISFLEKTKVSCSHFTLFLFAFLRAHLNNNNKEAHFLSNTTQNTHTQELASSIDYGCAQMVGLYSVVMDVFVLVGRFDLLGELLSLFSRWINLYPACQIATHQYLHYLSSPPPSSSSCFNSSSSSSSGGGGGGDYDHNLHHEDDFDYYYFNGADDDINVWPPPPPPPPLQQVGGGAGGVGAGASVVERFPVL